MNPATAAPIVKPFETTSIAITRERFGLYSPTSATAFGMIAPRPRPPMKRIARSCSRDVTRAVSSVSNEKYSVAPSRTGRRPILSASMLNSQRSDQHAHQREAGDTPGGAGDAPLGKQRRRDVAPGLDVEAVHDQAEAAQHEDADLERSDLAVVDDLGDVERRVLGRRGHLLLQPGLRAASHQGQVPGASV